MKKPLQAQDINDFGQEMKQPAVLDFRLSTLPRLVQGGKRFLLFVSIYAALIFASTGLFQVNIWIAIALAYLIGTAVSNFFFAPRRANKILRQRNEEIYAHLYHQVSSNRWAELLIGLGAVRNFDFYAAGPEETVDSLKAFLKDKQRMGTKECQQGHHPTCTHRLPAPIASWLNT